MIALWSLGIPDLSCLHGVEIHANAICMKFKIAH